MAGLAGCRQRRGGQELQRGDPEGQRGRTVHPRRDHRRRGAQRPDRRRVGPALHRCQLQAGARRGPRLRVDPGRRCRVRTAHRRQRHHGFRYADARRAGLQRRLRPGRHRGHQQRGSQRRYERRPGGFDHPAEGRGHPALPLSHRRGLHGLRSGRRGDRVPRRRRQQRRRLVRRRRQRRTRGSPGVRGGRPDRGADQTRGRRRRGRLRDQRPQLYRRHLPGGADGLQYRLRVDS